MDKRADEKIDVSNLSANDMNCTKYRLDENNTCHTTNMSTVTETSQTNGLDNTAGSESEEEYVPKQNHNHETVTALLSETSQDIVNDKEDAKPVCVHVLNETGAKDSNKNGVEDDVITSMVDLEKINSIKSKRSSSKKSGRKESLEQRLRRTFTIKDEHTNEVTKRIIAIVVKYSLFIFNFLSWVVATVAIGTGIWMLTDRTIIVTSDSHIIIDPPKMTVIGGSITFIVALLGCVGALRENLVLLKVFFYVLIVILLGEMVLGVAVFIIYTVPEARENFLRSQPEKLLRTAIQKYMDDDEIKSWVDMIQSKPTSSETEDQHNIFSSEPLALNMKFPTRVEIKFHGRPLKARHCCPYSVKRKFKCCGISHTEEGFRDWSISQYFNCTPSNKSIYRCAVPMSCCIFEAGDRINTMCGFAMTDKPVIDVKDYIHVRGCIQGFGEWLSKYDDLIIISCLSILIMQFLAVLSAKLMVIRITKKKTRWKVLHRRHSSTSNTVTIPTTD